MEIKCVAGFSVITKQPAASASLYKEALALPLITVVLVTGVPIGVVPCITLKVIVPW